jgi:hypothetical protein
VKRFSTTLSNGHALESSAPHEARNWTHFDAAQTFALAGKPVDAATFYAAVEAGCDAWEAKKAETHKRVRVLHGSSVLGRVTKWVRK